MALVYISYIISYDRAHSFTSNTVHAQYITLNFRTFLCDLRLLQLYEDHPVRRAMSHLRTLCFEIPKWNETREYFWTACFRDISDLLQDRLLLEYGWYPGVRWFDGGSCTKSEFLVVLQRTEDPQTFAEIERTLQRLRDDEMVHVIQMSQEDWNKIRVARPMWHWIGPMAFWTGWVAREWADMLRGAV